VVACKKDDSYSGGSGVVDNSTSVDFKSLMLLVNVKNSDTSFVVTEQIDSIELYLNDSFWTYATSEIYDTSKVAYTVQNNLKIASSQVNYLVLADRVETPLTTASAGDYAAYLNGVFDVNPGQYACLVKSFQLKFEDGHTETFYPNSYHVFEIKYGSSNAFVGNIELKTY
jgi:CMP-2-keto-3-deoxyoctulosonic acid synthetase